MENKKKYRIAVEERCDDNVIYEMFFDDIKSFNYFYFTGNRDFRDTIPTWYEDIKMLCEDVENYVEYYLDYYDEYKFADVLEGATDCVKSYNKTLSKHNIALNISKVLSIYDYIVGFGDYKEGIKSKLYFEDISADNYDEPLAVADFLAGVEENKLRGFCQGDYIECYYLSNNEDARQYFNKEWFECVYFGGLYQYYIIEVDSLEIDINSIDYWDCDVFIDQLCLTYNDNIEDHAQVDAIARVENEYTVTKKEYEIKKTA